MCGVSSTYITDIHLPVTPSGLENERKNDWGGKMSEDLRPNILEHRCRKRGGVVPMTTTTKVPYKPADICQLDLIIHDFSHPLVSLVNSVVSWSPAGI